MQASLIQSLMKFGMEKNPYIYLFNESYFYTLKRIIVGHYGGLKKAWIAINNIC